MATLDKIWLNFMQCDNVTIIVFGKPDVTPPPRGGPSRPQVATDKRTAHRPPGLFVSQIEPVYEAMKELRASKSQDIKTDPKYHFNSFFVEGPDGVSIEIVEEKPVPEGIWE